MTSPLSISVQKSLEKVDSLAKAAVEKFQNSPTLPQDAERALEERLIFPPSITQFSAGWADWGWPKHHDDPAWYLTVQNHFTRLHFDNFLVYTQDGFLQALFTYCRTVHGVRHLDYAKDLVDLDEYIPGVCNRVQFATRVIGGKIVLGFRSEPRPLRVVQNSAQGSGGQAGWSWTVGFQVVL